MQRDAALVTTGRKYNLKRDQQRREEEQENRDREAGQWINEDGTGDDNIAEVLLMNETVPVGQDGDRIVLMIRKGKFHEPEETQGPTDVV